MEKKVKELERRERKFLQRLRALVEANQKWRMKVDKMELKMEELEEALKEARIQDAVLRSMGDIRPEFRDGHRVVSGLGIVIPAPDP